MSDETINRRGQILGTNSIGETRRVLVDDEGNVYTKLIGSKLAEQKTQADAVANIITFSANISAIEIYHEEATWQAFIVNGLTVNVPAGGWSRPIDDTPAATVTIPAGINCIVGRLV